jgi:hypothetical protein
MDAIMDCMRDKEIRPDDKSGALSLIPFLAIDQSSQAIFIKMHLEEVFIELLKDYRNIGDKLII